MTTMTRFVFMAIAGCAMASSAMADNRMFNAANSNQALACRAAQEKALKWLNQNAVSISASHASTDQSRCDCVGDSQQGYTCTVEVRITPPQ